MTKNEKPSATRRGYSGVSKAQHKRLNDKVDRLNDRVKRIGKEIEDFIATFGPTPEELLVVEDNQD